MPKGDSDVSQSTRIGIAGRIKSEVQTIVTEQLLLLRAEEQLKLGMAGLQCAE